MSDVVLHMFPASHYNEKVRWALDWKGIAHERVPYLPGPHLPQIRRLSGQGQTPVLVLRGEVIAGSARILEALERAFPARPLFPAEPAARERALAIARRADEEIGPAVRTLVFSELLHEADFLCAIFTRGQPAWKQRLYRATFPLARPLIARANGVNAENVPRARERVERALDETARSVRPSGQLVGAAFDVADLTTAALLAPLADVAHPDMARPQPVPPRMGALYARYADHPAIRWVEAQYARHRPAPTSVPS